VENAVAGGRSLGDPINVPLTIHTITVFAKCAPGSILTIMANNKNMVICVLILDQAPPGEDLNNDLPLILVFIDSIILLSPHLDRTLGLLICPVSKKMKASGKSVAKGRRRRRRKRKKWGMGEKGQKSFIYKREVLWAHLSKIGK